LGIPADSVNYGCNQIALTGLSIYSNKFTARLFLVFLGADWFPKYLKYILYICRIFVKNKYKMPIFN
jgi:hypothetical protein